MTSMGPELSLVRSHSGLIRLHNVPFKERNFQLEIKNCSTFLKGLNSCRKHPLVSSSGRHQDHKWISTPLSPWSHPRGLSSAVGPRLLKWLFTALSPVGGSGQVVSELQPSLFNVLVIVLETRPPSPLSPNSRLWLFKSWRGSESVKYSKWYPPPPCIHNKSSGNVRVPRISEPPLTYPCSSPPPPGTGNTLSQCTRGTNFILILYLT